MNFSSAAGVGFGLAFLGWSSCFANWQYCSCKKNSRTSDLHVLKHQVTAVVVSYLPNDICVVSYFLNLVMVLTGDRDSLPGMMVASLGFVFVFSQSYDFKIRIPNLTISDWIHDFNVLQSIQVLHNLPAAELRSHLISTLQLSDVEPVSKGDSVTHLMMS